MSLWTDAGIPGAFGPERRGPEHLAAVERIKDWTRARFALGDADTVLVTESATRLPGYPPRETVVAFWGADGRRHHFRAFKPAHEVVEEDVPPAWLKESLTLSQGIECACC